MTASPSAQRACYTTRTRDRSTCPFATPSGWLRSESNLRWALGVTAAITLWPKRSTGWTKVELIHRRAPWKTAGPVELAKLQWVRWFNHHQLPQPVQYIPPAEAEANYWRQLAEKDKLES